MFGIFRKVDACLDAINRLSTEFRQLEQSVNLFRGKVSHQENHEARIRELEAKFNKFHGELLMYRELAAFDELPGQRDKEDAA